jgi:secreted Zn-dependent insulinase-like peptidase
MTENQRVIKQIRKDIMNFLGNSLSSFTLEQKEKLKEFLEVNVDFKKNKIVISLPLSFARWL